VILIFAGIIVLAAIFGFLAVGVVVGIMLLMSLLVGLRVAWLRLRAKFHDDGRRNVRIVRRTSDF